MGISARKSNCFLRSSNMKQNSNPFKGIYITLSCKILLLFSVDVHTGNLFKRVFSTDKLSFLKLRKAPAYVENILEQRQRKIRSKLLGILLILTPVWRARHSIQLETSWNIRKKIFQLSHMLNNIYWWDFLGRCVPGNSHPVILCQLS